MPHVNIWVRKDDWSKWKLIDNKSELISQAINRSVITPVIKKTGKIKTNQQVIPAALVYLETCNGQHVRFRANCGRKGCPWA